MPDVVWDEIDLLTSVDAFIDPNSYVNTGFAHSIYYSTWNEENERESIQKNILTNETNSIVICRTITKKYDENYEEVIKP